MFLFWISNKICCSSIEACFYCNTPICKHKAILNLDLFLFYFYPSFIMYLYDWVNLWASFPWRFDDNLYWLGHKFSTLFLGQLHGISFEWFPWPWQTVDPISGSSPVADFSLAFFKEVWVPPLELRRTWFACTVTSDEETLSGIEPRPPAHGVNTVSLLVWSLTLGLSGMCDSTCIAPKITETLKPYHDDNVESQSAGEYL